MNLKQKSTSKHPKPNQASSLLHLSPSVLPIIRTGLHCLSGGRGSGARRRWWCTTFQTLTLNLHPLTLRLELVSGDATVLAATVNLAVPAYLSPASVPVLSLSVLWSQGFRRVATKSGRARHDGGRAGAGVAVTPSASPLSFSPFFSGVGVVGMVEAEPPFFLPLHVP